MKFLWQFSKFFSHIKSDVDKIGPGAQHFCSDLPPLIKTRSDENRPFSWNLGLPDVNFASQSFHNFLISTLKSLSRPGTQNDLSSSKTARNAHLTGAARQHWSFPQKCSRMKISRGTRLASCWHSEERLKFSKCAMLFCFRRKRPLKFEPKDITWMREKSENFGYVSPSLWPTRHDWYFDVESDIARCIVDTNIVLLMLPRASSSNDDSMLLKISIFKVLYCSESAVHWWKAF